MTYFYFQTEVDCFPQPREVRKRHHVAPCFDGKFISHYVDREIRLIETKERMESSVRQHTILLDRQDELKEKYEMVNQK